uniref:NADH-ubiquinone oxidoreductase chain 5 n=1 Tax=Argas lagenoplastis TaxID=182350 RepID=W0FHS8_ARGLA|nr:NADH dehydrogenase subunit 5 [Argas lagenoplastis]AHF21607.1 NADH dehydrogenase subunit 5 [Argas lagenoplastis]
MFLVWGIFLLIVSMFSFSFSLLFLMNMEVYVLEYSMVGVGGLEVKFFLLLDWMSLMFMSVVLFIASMVVIYSEDYMSGDLTKLYFLYGVLLFVGSMILMIFSLNLLMILLGWDGLGLTSYCLVIYYQNSKSDSAGMMTVLSNRVGDVMVLLSIVMFMNFGTLDFMNFNKLLWISVFFLIVAGMTKSAQIPFSAWLPAAMAAPTPVSSLVHSSTLVTAGVYLLIRLSIFFQVGLFSSFLLFLSLLTMVMAGFGAVLEMDLKKIIALSTLSQIGLMMLVLAIGLPILSFFHLLTHAIFKAMLFLCAGVMIHNSLGKQDIRLLGFFFKMNPGISGALGLSSLSLFGFPFLSGFYSKDLLLEYIYENEISIFVLILLVMATILTCVYSMRLMYYVIWNALFKNSSMINLSLSMFMWIPIFVMGVVVIFFGSVLMWMIFPEPIFVLLNYDVKMMNLLILVFSMWIFFLCYFNVSGFEGKIYGADFLSSLWFLSTFSSFFPMKVFSGSSMFMMMESKWLEEFGPMGLYSMNFSFSKIIQWFQINSIFSFLLFVIYFLFIV